MVLIAAVAVVSQLLVPQTTTEERMARLHAATALWLVEVNVRLQGEFVREEDGERVGVDTITKWDGWGSAVAVSDSGDLLTARHVVDSRYLVAVACKIKLRDYASGHAASARVDFAFSDVAGSPAVQVVSVLPKLGDSDLCADPLQARWTIAEGSTARTVALDDTADLALVKLDIGRIPSIPFAVDTPTAGDPVTVLGYDGRNQRLVRMSGSLTALCTAVLEEASDDDVIILPQPEPLSETTATVWPGMSGGALLAGERLVGINAKSDAECTDGGQCATHDVTSDAVPGSYALAWYLWVVGASKERPVPCTPEPAPATSAFDPFGGIRHR